MCVWVCVFNWGWIWIRLHELKNSPSQRTDTFFEGEMISNFFFYFLTGILHFIWMLPILLRPNRKAYSWGASVCVCVKDRKKLTSLKSSKSRNDYEDRAIILFTSYKDDTMISTRKTLLRLSILYGLQSRGRNEDLKGRWICYAS